MILQLWTRIPILRDCFIKEHSLRIKHLLAELTQFRTQLSQDLRCMSAIMQN